MSEAVDLTDFRAEVRQWAEANFPASLKGVSPAMEGGQDPAHVDALEQWRKALAERGYGAPTWPKEYGGAGLDQPHARAVAQEIARAGGFNHIPLITGMGITMVGPTILDFGTDEQKARHLPGIASGEIRWCLGLSEPNAGSDLASLATKCEDKGDEWVINGQKIWTSGADISQWCGALVRTDSSGTKHEGISFVMLPMDQPGVETRPIRLISGASPFCETFFNDAKAVKDDLLSDPGNGWNVIKRLLQHERASQTGAGGPRGEAGRKLQDLAKEYVGTDSDGRLADQDLRGRLTRHLMDAEAHKLTTDRITAEAKGNVNVSAAASIMKNSATDVTQAKAELMLELMGYQGLGWEGDAFTPEEIGAVRDWLWGKAISIYGGSKEVQKNIISKNILGLPEMTQKG
ncbi:MAG: acyl-CoA dehydrogenase family protein [Pseudomonadales bacterium]|jgi:alkylation response protein AidB-like acyl-CoA dehydrogenase|nr:acyl-CoA dehydrogenase family protein [Pseudomonadales bacterium]